METPSPPNFLLQNIVNGESNILTNGGHSNWNGHNTSVDGINNVEHTQLHLNLAGPPETTNDQG